MAEEDELDGLDEALADAVGDDDAGDMDPLAEEMLRMMEEEGDDGGGVAPYQALPPASLSEEGQLACLRTSSGSWMCG
jgi:hypothetical protein